MDSCRKRPQALDQSGCGRVEKFVANTVDAAGLTGAHLAPATVADDLFQRHAITRAAPGRDKDVGVLVKHCLGQALRTCFADELATRCFDQFRDPFLRSNEWLSPFFTKDAWALCVLGLSANRFDFMLHLDDDLLAALRNTHYSGDRRNIGVDVGQSLRGDSEEARSGP